MARAPKTLNFASAGATRDRSKKRPRKTTRRAARKRRPATARSKNSANNRIRARLNRVRTGRRKDKASRGGGGGRTNRGKTGYAYEGAMATPRNLGRYQG